MKNFSFISGRGLACYTFFLAILLSSFPSFALPLENKKTLANGQAQQTITGTIRDASGPLPGVLVSIKGNPKFSTSSDLNGSYTLPANIGDVLVFSFVGYATQEITIVSFSQLDILMAEDTATLEELTINAGYYSVKQKESTGSIARITSKDIEQQPVTNPLAVLTGRMAGVSVIQDSGTPGGNFQINIRGINSLRADGNAPLYIVDGVPFSSETIGSTQTSGYSPSQTSPLNSINPADIESIEVLKDADATAIYGSRGANGVVLITTKKGRVGKSAFNASASTAFGSVTRMLDLMDTPQYLQMRREAFANDGFTEYPDYAYDVNGTWDQNRYTDWQKVLIGGTAEIHNFQAGVSGGSASTQYVLSGTYRTETTVLPGDFRYDKGAVHFNMNHKSDDEKFSLRVAADYVTQDNDQPGVDLTTTARTLAPNAPALYTPEGELNWENSTWGNPLAELNSKFLSNTNSLSTNILLAYNFRPNLQFRASMGYTDLHHKESRTRPSTMNDPAFGMGSESSSLNINTTTRRSWIIEPQLNYTTYLGKGKLEALVGTTLQRQQTDRLYQSGYNFASNSLIYDLASAAVKNVQRNDQVIYKYQAGFARVNFNWDGKYIINVTGRRDGSSRFGSGNRFANFGAIGGAWLFANEAFLEGNPVISFGKLRASYGTTGNDQIGDYQFLDTYASSGNNYQGVTGLQPNRLYNPAFGWETNKKLEMALELGFLKDRLFLTAAYYRNRSSDQLVGIPMPATTGFTALKEQEDDLPF